MTAGLMDLAMTWLPILVLIGVFGLFVSRSERVYAGRTGKTHGELLEDYLTELKRQNDLIERIVDDQEQRLQRLEQSRRSSSGGGGSGASR
jgi:hypothetical protein